MTTTDVLTRCQPPWLVFPQIDPQTLPVHLRQGVAEPWFDQQWRPFWAALTAEQKAQYLDHWNASPDWRAAIAFHFDRAWESDAEADAAESIQYQQDLKQARAKPSLLSRWFGRKR